MKELYGGKFAKGKSEKGGTVKRVDEKVKF